MRHQKLGFKNFQTHFSQNLCNGRYNTIALKRRSTMMSSSLIIFYMAPCFRELLSLVTCNEKSSFETTSALYDE